MPTRKTMTLSPARCAAATAAALLASALLGPTGVDAAKIFPTAVKNPACVAPADGGTTGASAAARPGPGTTNPDVGAFALDQTATGGDIQFVPGTAPGTAQDDIIHGTPGDDRFSGGGCDDHLIGYTGNDHLAGTKGDDKVEGNDGHDMLYGEEGDDILLAGDDGNTDHLYGGLGDDYLSAGGGNGATMLGEEGRDIYVGAPGYADAYFVRGTPDRGAGLKPDLRTSDVIENFEAIDYIRLIGYTLGNPTKTPDESQYSVYPGEGALAGFHILTWNAPEDEGYHDVIVGGANPSGRVLTHP